MESLLLKINAINQHFRQTDEAENLRLMQRLVKLNEEVGELCEAALCEQDINQRPKGKATDFDAELADVIICSLMLSTGREKNIETEVHKKLDVLLQKFNLTL